MSELLLEIADKIKPLLEVSREGISLEQVKLRSFTECSECGEQVNDGYFILSKSPNEHIVMSYKTFHDIDIHLTYEKDHGAKSAVLNDLERENEKKEPRDQLSLAELQAQIKKYSLEELHKKVLEIVN